jgi:hypothetical protein
VGEAKRGRVRVYDFREYKVTTTRRTAEVIKWAARYRGWTEQQFIIWCVARTLEAMSEQQARIKEEAMRQEAEAHDGGGGDTPQVLLVDEGQAGGEEQAADGSLQVSVV